MKLSYTVATPDVQDEKILALRGDFESNLAQLSNYGYHGVEVMVRDVSTLEASYIKGLCKRHNLEIAAISSGQLTFEDGYVLSATDEGWRQKSVEATKKVVDFTKAVGTDIINIGTLRGKLPDDPNERQAADKAMVKSMAEVLDYAASQHVVVAFEPQCRYVVNWHNATHETFEWMQQLGRSNFKILFDVYHSMVEDLSVNASIIKYIPDIAHVQISDSTRLAPGKGQWNLHDIIRLLKAAGYGNFISVEVLQKPAGLDAARQAAAYLLPVISEND